MANRLALYIKFLAVAIQYLVIHSLPKARGEPGTTVANPLAKFRRPGNRVSCRD
jgi:hypothetical protein